MSLHVDMAAKKTTPFAPEVARCLEDPLGSDGSLIDDVHRWHHPILVRKPQSLSRKGALRPGPSLPCTCERREGRPTHARSRGGSIASFDDFRGSSRRRSAPTIASLGPRRSRAAETAAVTLSQPARASSDNAGALAAACERKGCSCLEAAAATSEAPTKELLSLVGCDNKPAGRWR